MFYLTWRKRLKLCIFIRYTAENSVEFGAPRDTDHPELRQPQALEIWNSLLKTLDRGSKITILTSGPLTNLAKIMLSSKNASSIIQVYSLFILLFSLNIIINKRSCNRTIRLLHSNTLCFKISCIESCLFYYYYGLFLVEFIYLFLFN